MSDNAVARGSRPYGARTGMPVGTPYAYRTGGPRREAQVHALLAAIRASDTAGPGADDVGFEWYRERALENGEPVAPAAPPPPARCDVCGYLTTRCRCPGGPRG